MAENLSTTKGPIVWLDMDQKELDDAYDQTVYAPNQQLVAKRRKLASEAARDALTSFETTRPCFDTRRM